MKKRGISAVVATILIILIVVVGVGIVWKVILPIFQELEFLSYSDVQLNIVRQGFTVYDPEQNFAFVQIERGKDEVNVTGVEIGFSFGGTTKTYQSKSVPTPNGKYTYKFNFTNDSDMGIPQNVTPDKVTVAPIFTINNKLRLGKILDSEDMPVGRARLSAAEWEKANNESATAIVVTTGSGGGPGVPQNDQGDDDNDQGGGVTIVCIGDNRSYSNGTLIEVCLDGCSAGVCLIKQVYYYDSDGDGYGNDSISQEFEVGMNTSGYILNDGDCDDTSDSISPAEAEIFNNPVDEDCNGFSDLNKCLSIRDSGNYLLSGDFVASAADITSLTVWDLDYPGYITDISACIFINGSQINLNLGGQNVTCEPSTCAWAGVYIRDSDYVNVSDGILSKGFSWGLISYNSQDVLLYNLSIHGTGYGGMDMHFTNNSIVNKIIMTNPGTMGLKVWKSSHNSFEDNKFCGSGLWNVYCNVAQDNSGSGNIFDSPHYWKCPNWNVVPTASC